MPRMQGLHHFCLLDHEHGCWHNRRCCPNRLRRQTAFSKEFTRPWYRHNRFFARLIDDRKLHAPLLNVHNVLGGSPLREDCRSLLKFDNLSGHARGIKKLLGVKMGLLSGFLTARGSGNSVAVLGAMFCTGVEDSTIMQMCPQGDRYRQPHLSLYDPVGLSRNAGFPFAT
jgi:hypothetical protein